MPYDIKVRSNDLPKFSSRSFFFLNSYDLFCAAVAANIYKYVICRIFSHLILPIYIQMSKFNNLFFKIFFLFINLTKRHTAKEGTQAQASR